MTGMPSHALLLEDLPDVAAWLATLLRDRFPGIEVAHISAAMRSRSLYISWNFQVVSTCSSGNGGGEG